MKSRVQMRRVRRVGQRGFTLVELIVTFLVIAVLAAIALPTYTEHVAKGRRAEAAAALMAGAQALERYYSANGRYVTAAGGDTLPNVFPVQVPESGTAYYTIAAPDDVDPTDTAFTLRATRAGIMANDACGNLELTQSGARSMEKDTATKTAEECWRR